MRAEIPLNIDDAYYAETHTVTTHTCKSMHTYNHSNIGAQHTHERFNRIRNANKQSKIESVPRAIAFWNVIVYKYLLVCVCVCAGLLFM